MAIGARWIGVLAVGLLGVGVGLQLYGVIDILPSAHLHLRPKADTGRPLVPASFDKIAAAEIDVDGTTYRFVRASRGHWSYVASGSQGNTTGRQSAVTEGVGRGRAATIGISLSAFAGATVIRDIDAGGAVQDYGVLRPEMTISFYDDVASPRPLIRYFVGDEAPDDAGRYAMEFGSFAVVVLPTARINDLKALIAPFRGTHGAGG